MLIVFVILFLLVVVVYWFLQQPQFGKVAAGTRLGRIRQSPNYKNDQFQNLSDTPALTEGANIAKVMRTFFFGKSKRNVPSVQLPSKKTDLFQLDPNEDLLVWFGHSSYYLQLNGKKFLVDPVLNGHASPVRFLTRSFKGSDVYTTADIPSIDYLLITHDHYDHLDHQTIIQLRPKIEKVITGLGVGAHLEDWGYDPQIIIEKDWNEHLAFDDGIEVNTTPARHFSGRKFKRNTSLWLSFVVITPTKKVFIGGDSGYDRHFTYIGNRYGPFDLAILENGQYNQYWKYIHMMPEEAVQAAMDLKAKKLLPVHWSKFSLSIHAWDEPINRITKEAKRKGVPVVHPMIGEVLYLNKPDTSTAWWESVK